MVRIDRVSLWALDREPYRGVKHRFYTDKETGHRTHYVESGDTSTDSELVILVGQLLTIRFLIRC